MADRRVALAHRNPASMNKSGGAPQNWQTPTAYVAELARRHTPRGTFDIDACADASNHIAPVWFGPGSPFGEDALTADWRQPDVFVWNKPAVFMNPMWAHCPAFVLRMLMMVLDGRVSVVVPAATPPMPVLSWLLGT